MKIKMKHVVVIFAMFLLCILSACGCNGDGTIDYSSAEGTLKETHLSTITTEINTVLETSGLGANELSVIISEIRTNFNGTNTTEVIKNALTKSNVIIDIDEKTNEIYANVLNAVRIKAKAILGNFYNLEDLKTHQVETCEKQKLKTESILDTATEINTDIVKDKVVSDTVNVYQMMSNYYQQITKLKSSNSPIRVFNIKEDGFFPTIFNNFLVYPIGWILQFIAKAFGGYYIVGVLFVTILIRTLMTPVYNSTNNMSLKMQLMQPDLQKLEAKYANRTDPESQQAKQMEQMKIYKKYKMGFGGCLSMFFQLPVFLGVYHAVTRIQMNDGTILDSPNWIDGMNSNFLGIDLFLEKGEPWTWQFWGVMIILVLVVGTQILQQVFTTLSQKKTYEKSQENIPEYKRKAMQQNQTNGSMKFMMYFMIFMMGVFVFQSAAGLGLYWLIGNVYSLIQMFLNYKNADKKLARLKKKLNIGE